MKGSPRQLSKNEINQSLLTRTAFLLAVFLIVSYGLVNIGESLYRVERDYLIKKKEARLLDSRIKDLNQSHLEPDDIQKERAVRENLQKVKPGEDLIVIIPKDK